MATYTPPPYFPQGSLAPPNKSRYRKFKFLMMFLALLLILVVAGAGYAIWYLLKYMW